MPDRPDYRDVDDLVSRLSLLDKTEATQELGEFYVSARFGLNHRDFLERWTDGANDGGIDLYHTEDGTFYVLQSKFVENPDHLGAKAITTEIDKLFRTLSGPNPNRRADPFVNDVRRGLGAKGAYLEYLFLTSGLLRESAITAAREHLRAAVARKRWKLGVEIVSIDRDGLEGVIYDSSHGYTPYTGRKSLPVQRRQVIQHVGEESRILSVTCSIRAIDILRWFSGPEDINRYLRKNVRGYVGDKAVNHKIGVSFVKTPDLFWYKHNGLILFADAVNVSNDRSNLILRNPQVVNGGQTLRTIYDRWDEDGRPETPAQMLLRIYRVPAEGGETYGKSVEIIAALNSQNQIKESDLHANDARQVRLESLLRRLDYAYIRKRSTDLRHDRRRARFQIEMTHLALLYLSCNRREPRIGVAGGVQAIFADPNKYEEAFPDDAMYDDLDDAGAEHIVVRYVTLWNLYYAVVLACKNGLPEAQSEHSEYTLYYVLTDMYQRLWNAKRRFFRAGSWHDWDQFVRSDSFRDRLWPYCGRAFRAARRMAIRDPEPRKFLLKPQVFGRFQRMTSQKAFDRAFRRALHEFRE